MYAKDFRASARTALSGSWGSAVLVTFLMMVISALGSLVLAGIVVMPVISWSFSIIFLAALRRKKIEAQGLFVGFNYFGKIWAMSALSFLFVFFWSLLLVIPGIIKAFSYSMAPYILADHPNMKALDAITASRAMMHGNKWRLFCLQLSFFGWALLACLTFGIGELWLIPYMETATASFYEDIKNKASSQEYAAV